MLKLYDYELSGNCFKARLLLSMLGVSYDTEIVEYYPEREHKSADFLRINPLGQLPVLQNGDKVIRESQAILVYLATKFDLGRKWYPLDSPDALADIQIWLAFSDGITASISAARLHELFMYDFDVEECRNRAYVLLEVMDKHLWVNRQQGFDFLCPMEHPTIADIACFPYIAMADEAGISLQDYPSVRLWLDSVKRIPGFIAMSGIFPVSNI
ncbi:TPA: glutathione S-transferase [Klebsiella pneumoniae]|nr:glutathione S-transferase [Klebsiella pneumoniae]HBW6529885.1 glutathione S-transferase [Klebsiella pneumoniae]